MYEKSIIRIFITSFKIFYGFLVVFCIIKAHPQIKITIYKQFEKDFFNELCRVVFHGVLHLCSYNDKTESEISIMRSKEEFYIDNFVSRETK